MTDLSQLCVTTKAAVLLEALPYIQKFQGSIFVVKYGGAFMDYADPTIRMRVITDIALLSAVGIKVVVVHGGGKAITRAMEDENVETRFEHGLRVTSKEAVQIAERVLNQVVNPSICESLKAKMAQPVGIHGNDVFLCDPKKIQLEGELIDLGYVGDIHTVKTEVITKALDAGHIPVISPIACDQGGQVYNTNADSAASNLAIAMNALRLVYLCDVPGLMRDVTDPQSLISSLKVDEADTLIKNGTISKGMIPKVSSAVEALRRDVHRVHFVHGETPHSLLLEIFTDKGVGTEIIHA